MANQVVFKDKRVKKFLKSLEKNTGLIKDRKEKYVSLISALVYQDIIDHFEKEQGPKGKWKRSKRAISQKGQTLQDTGRLRNSLVPISNGNNWEKDSGGILWFTNVKYSGKHDRGEEGMPKRSFMWLSDSGLDKISRLTLKFIMSNK